MKNHRFLWLRNRTTNNRKCEKARNIKEKRTIEMFSGGFCPLFTNKTNQNGFSARYFPPRRRKIFANSMDGIL